MTTESNPLVTALGYMPILEYRWYGTAGTCKPSGFTVIAFYENSRKLPGTLSERGLANRVRGGNKKQKHEQKDKKRNKNKKKEYKKEQKPFKKMTVTLTPD